MKAVEAKYEPKQSWKQEMRDLPIKSGYLIAPLEKRDSFQAMATSMKRKEGLEFELRKVDTELHIWRLK